MEIVIPMFISLITKNALSNLQLLRKIMISINIKTINGSKHTKIIEYIVLL